jgi:hypothetical protein
MPARDDAKRIPQVATELWELSVAYAKQETVDPFKGLGHFLAYGFGGVAALSLGSILLLVAGLRFLQTETGSTFTGNLSWIPYVIVSLVATLFVTLLIWRVVKRKGPGL